MGLDLSALDSAPPALPGSDPNGEPLVLLLDDIEVDPNQPRKSFDPTKMAELVASVKSQGVISPVSVRPHPDKPGKWMLNYGERRYRASREAGLSEIPAFVHLKLDDYAQVVENLQREDLQPMELALFIARKLDDGDKKGQIAKMLGVDASVITQHLSLIDPPAFIEDLYNSGRCTAVRVLYDLRSLHKQFPSEVEDWASTASEITRSAVSGLAEVLKNPPSATRTEETSSEKANGKSEKFGPDQISAGGGASDAKPSTGNGDGKEPAHAPTTKTPRSQKADGAGDGGADPDADAGGDGSRTSWPRGKVASDPTLMKKPLLLVVVDGRAATVLLNRKPTTVGLIHVRYENGENAEVAASDCVIDSISDEDA